MNPKITKTYFFYKKVNFAKTSKNQILFGENIILQIQ